MDTEVFGDYEQAEEGVKPEEEVTSVSLPKQTEAFVLLKNQLDELDAKDKRVSSITFYADHFSISIQD